MRNDLGPEIMKDTFHFRQKLYNLRNHLTLQRQRNRTMYFGTESLSSFGPRMWEIDPCEIKNAKSLDIFKEKIKNFVQQTNVLADFVKGTLAM